MRCTRNIKAAAGSQYLYECIFSTPFFFFSFFFVPTYFTSLLILLHIKLVIKYDDVLFLTFDPQLLFGKFLDLASACPLFTTEEEYVPWD